MYVIVEKGTSEIYFTSSSKIEAIRAGLILQQRTKFDHGHNGFEIMEVDNAKR